MVEFELLVDREHRAPFRAKTKHLVPLIDVQDYARGALLTVAHPEPAYGTVYIVDRPVPKLMQPLDASMARAAKELPPNPKAKGGGLRPISTIIFILAFLVGAIGAPFLVTRDALAYVELIVEGRTDDFTTVDHPDLFAPEHLRESFDALETETGSSEVYALDIWQDRLVAGVASADAPGMIENVHIQDHTVTDVELGTASIAEFELPAVDLTDIDWDAVLAAVPDAEAVLRERGVLEPEFTRIGLALDPSDALPVQVRLFFSTSGSSEAVRMDVHGDLLPEELLAQMPDDERMKYLWDVEALEGAVSEIMDAMQASEWSRVVHFGDRILVHGYRTDESGVPVELDLTYRDGRVRTIEAAPAGTVDREEVFAESDVDWAALANAIPDVQSAMTEAGAPETELSHTIIERVQLPRTDALRTVARFYLSNSADEGGVIEVDMAGNILRIMGR